MSKSFRPHGLQHARLPCPSLSLRVCWNSCLLSQWCYPTISSSPSLFVDLQSFPASGSFPMGWLFASSGQNIGVSALASALPMNIQGWFPLELTGFISLQTSVVHHKNAIHFHLHFIPFLAEILYGYHCLSQWLSVEASQSGALRLNHTLCLTCPKILSAFTRINLCLFICKGCSDSNYSTCICLGEKSMI